MPSITPLIETFPYTFPIVFGKADGLVGIGDYEPVLPIEYRYTIPSIFFEQEPSHWPGFIDVLQQTEELRMPVWPIEETTSGAYLYPYIFGGTSLDQLFDKDLSWWQNVATKLMPEYPPEMITGTAHTDPSIFMQLSTPTFLPDGTGAASPTSTVAVDSGQTSTEAV